jgi:hypothetical protein
MGIFASLCKLCNARITEMKKKKEEVISTNDVVLLSK